MSQPRVIRDIPSLNGLRAISILIVFWGHADFHPIIVGSTGVTVFFFISGFLITTLMIREHRKTGTVSIKDFYLRRFLRILPPLYIVLAAVVVASLAGWIVNGMTGGGLAASALFGSNYYIIAVGRNGLPGGMEALWSLAVEEHYYLLFPVVFLLLRRFLPHRHSAQASILAALCVLILLWRLLLSHQGAGYDRLYLSTDTRLDGILAGAVLALLWSPERMQRKWAHRKALASLVFIAGAVVVFAVAKVNGSASLTIVYTIEELVLAAVFIVVIGCPESLGARILNWGPLRWIGLVSYSVYLLHRPVLELAEQHLPGPHSTDVVFAVVVTFMLAELMRRLVENPAANLRRKLSHAGQHQEVPQAA